LFAPALKESELEVWPGWQPGEPVKTLLSLLRDILWHRKFRPAGEAYFRQKSVLAMEHAI